MSSAHPKWNLKTRAGVLSAHASVHFDKGYTKEEFKAHHKTVAAAAKRFHIKLHCGVK